MSIRIYYYAQDKRFQPFADTRQPIAQLDSDSVSELRNWVEQRLGCKVSELSFQYESNSQDATILWVSVVSGPTLRYRLEQP